MNPESDSRRSFVKKSLAVGIAAAQPAFLAGLVRADGGGGSGGTDTKTLTTDPYTSHPETDLPETATTLPPDSTYGSTGSY